MLGEIFIYIYIYIYIYMYIHIYNFKNKTDNTFQLQMRIIEESMAYLNNSFMDKWLYFHTAKF